MRLRERTIPFLYSRGEYNLRSFRRLRFESELGSDNRVNGSDTHTPFPRQTLTLSNSSSTSSGVPLGLHQSPPSLERIASTTFRKTARVGNTGSQDWRVPRSRCPSTRAACANCTYHRPHQLTDALVRAGAKREQQRSVVPPPPPRGSQAREARLDARCRDLDGARIA